MKKLLLAAAVVASVSFATSCKQRDMPGSGVLGAGTANAAPGDTILTADGQRAYPSAKMLAAAQSALNAAAAARASGDAVSFKKHLSKARLHLRMRKVTATPASSGGQMITCRLQKKSAPAQFVTATFNPVTQADDGIGSDSLEFGEEAYSFSVGAREDDGKTVLDVFFYENISVQDEVGSMSCEVGNGEFCKEDISNDSGVIALFSCKKS